MIQLGGWLKARQSRRRETIAQELREADPLGPVEEHGDDNLIGKLDHARPFAAMTVALTNALRSNRAGEVADDYLMELREAIDAERRHRKNGGVTPCPGTHWT